MQHGQARTLVRLLRAVYIEDGQGGMIPESWTEVSSFYARVRAVASSESFSVGGEQASTSWTIETTYRIDVHEKDVLTIEPDELRVLEVTGIRDPDSRRRTIEIDAVERRLEDEEEIEQWQRQAARKSQLR
jgi:phage head-tail adaptor, putative, SPP1 family